MGRGWGSGRERRAAWADPWHSRRAETLPVRFAGTSGLRAGHDACFEPSACRSSAARMLPKEVAWMRLALVLVAAALFVPQEERSIEEELTALIEKTNALETFHLVYDMEATGEEAAKTAVFE